MSAQIPPVPTGDLRVITLPEFRLPLEIYAVGDTFWCAPGVVNGVEITKTDPIRGEQIGTGTGDVWVLAAYDNATGIPAGKPTIHHGGSAPESSEGVLVCKIGSYKTDGNLCTCVNSNYAPLAMIACPRPFAASGCGASVLSTYTVYLDGRIPQPIL